MIPKASQRAGGQDLATHLLNAHDNEFVEVAEVRGAVARDLHGAFAEWEAIASAMTNCRNYLYSLSVNPDWSQGGLTRDQYRDYADRVEEALGLSGQPRAMIYHIKHGREHCHIVWSRIDAVEGKAIHQAFDHSKLMMVTRELARDHGLKLPEGYYRDIGEENRPQLSLYEKQQERNCGLTKEERMAHVTAAWRRSDTPRAFVRALEDMGYILATGKRPYVLVDMYGNMNALPKLLDDRSIRTKDVRAFLEHDYPPESLPDVEEARALVRAHQKARDKHVEKQRGDKERDALKAMQQERRAKVEAERDALFARQRDEKKQLVSDQQRAQQALRQTYLAERKRVREQRAAHAPTGLAAFLGRITGVTHAMKQLQRRRDAQRYAAFATEKGALQEKHLEAVRDLDHRHKLQSLDMARQVRALDQIERRELKSFEEMRQAEQRYLHWRDHDHMPALNLQLKPRGRAAVPYKAKDRYRKREQEMTERPKRPRGIGPITLQDHFAQAAYAETDDDRTGRGSASDGLPKPKCSRNRKRRRGQEHDVPVLPNPSLGSAEPADPHWTQRPLGDTFWGVAKDDDGVIKSDDGGDVLRPSRASRQGKRGRGRQRGVDENGLDRER